MIVLKIPQIYEYLFDFPKRIPPLKASEQDPNLSENMVYFVKFYSPSGSIIETAVRSFGPNSEQLWLKQAFGCEKQGSCTAFEAFRRTAVSGHAGGAQTGMFQRLTRIKVGVFDPP